MIELRDVSRWYGNVVAVNAVSCTIAPGITGLLGPNGAGKSTDLHMIAGLLTPSNGSVLVDGQAVVGNRGVYRHIGLVPERESVQPFLKGFEFVNANARLQGLRDAKESSRAALALVNLDDAQHRRIGTYSKGMRQRIKLAAALVHEPAVLLLDEPFNGMDPRQRFRMMAMLQDLAAGGRTILISSHILEELNDLATNVLVMVSGRLAASGHFREIRRLMTDRPHTFNVRSSDDRALGALLLLQPSVFGIELTPDGITIRTAERGQLTRPLPRVARAEGISLFEIRPTDESLESVFSCLVKR